MKGGQGKEDCQEILIQAGPGDQGRSSAESREDQPCHDSRFSSSKSRNKGAEQDHNREQKAEIQDVSQSGTTPPSEIKH